MVEAWDLLGRIPPRCRHTEGLTETLPPSDRRLQAGYCPAHLRLLGSQVSQLFGREPRADQVPGSTSLVISGFRVDAGLEKRLSGFRGSWAGTTFSASVERGPVPIDGFRVSVGAMLKQETNDVGTGHEGGNMKRGPVPGSTKKLGSIDGTDAREVPQAMLEHRNPDGESRELRLHKTLTPSFLVLPSRWWAWQDAVSPTGRRARLR